MSNVQADILAAAAEYGVPGNLALAVAQQESGLNPTAVGDGGTSYGLYQLHAGGELGNLTPAQAFDPTTNADVALSELGAVIAANPQITDPGTLAALAQRPANPASYAASIDAILGTQTTTSSGGGTASSSAGGPIVTTSVIGSIGSTIGGALGGILGPVGAALGEKAGGSAGNAAGAAAGALSDPSGIVGSIGATALQVVLDAVLVAAGLGLILLGFVRLFPNAADHLPIPIPV